MRLQEKLLRQKTRQGLTTEALSERSGVPVGTINKLLNGETRNPTARTLQRLAAALHCPYETLLGDAPLPENILPLETRRVPVLGVIAAGEPIYDEEEPGCYIACDAALKCDFALRIEARASTTETSCSSAASRTWRTGRSPPWSSTARRRSSACTT